MHKSEAKFDKKMRSAWLTHLQVEKYPELYPSSLRDVQEDRHESSTFRPLQANIAEKKKHDSLLGV